MNRIYNLNNQSVSNEATSEWISKKDVAKNFGVSMDTLERTVEELNCRSTAAIQNHIKKGGYHNLETFYDTELINMIGLQLKKNAMNAGGQRTDKSIIKQDNIGDMAIGFVMTKGTYEQKMDMIAFLKEQAEKEHYIEEYHKRELAVKDAAIATLKANLDMNELMYDRYVPKTVYGQLGWGRE